MWSLRHPIDVGVIFDGQGLGTTLSSHAATFTAITSIPAEVTQLGTEPPLSVATKSMLFSIAHNAMDQRLPSCGSEPGGDSVGLRVGLLGALDKRRRQGFCLKTTNVVGTGFAICGRTPNAWAEVCT